MGVQTTKNGIILVRHLRKRDKGFNGRTALQERLEVNVPACHLDQWIDVILVHGHRRKWGRNGGEDIMHEDIIGGRLVGHRERLCDSKVPLRHRLHEGLNLCRNGTICGQSWVIFVVLGEMIGNGLLGHSCLVAPNTLEPVLDGKSLNWRTTWLGQDNVIMTHHQLMLLDKCIHEVSTIGNIQVMLRASMTKSNAWEEGLLARSAVESLEVGVPDKTDGVQEWSRLDVRDVWRTCYDCE